MASTALQRFAEFHSDDSLRYIYDLPALIYSKNERAGGILVNMSADGLRIACSGNFAIGQTIWVVVENWPHMACSVVWSKNGLIGCALDAHIDMTTLAKRLARSKGIDRSNDEIWI